MITTVAKLGLPDSPTLPLLALLVVRSPALPQKAVACCELLGFPHRVPCFWSFGSWYRPNMGNLVPYQKKYQNTAIKI